MPRSPPLLARSRAQLPVPHGCHQSSYCLGSMGTSYLWSVSRKLRNRAAHALTGNGPARRRPPSAWPCMPSSSSSSSPLVASAQQRARVANRAALPAELIAAGFSLSSTLPLRPQELLQLHRRRLTADERARVLRATGASHIVGDDVLCPSSGRGGAGLADFWKIAPAYSWGGASLPGFTLLSLAAQHSRGGGGGSRLGSYNGISLHYQGRQVGCEG